MKRKLIIDGNAVYEIDEDCMVRKCLREPDTSVEREENGRLKGQKIQKSDMKKYPEKYKPVLFTAMPCKLLKNL